MDTENTRRPTHIDFASTKCPTPKKKQYRSMVSAQIAKDRSANWYKKQVRPYRCQCGSWHLTTKPKRKRKAS